MLFDRQFWPGLADGTVTVAFRRWTRPTVKAGGTLQSPGGLLAIDRVEVIADGDVIDEDVHAAGFADIPALLASLRAEGQLYRVRFRRLGDDPRVELHERSDLDAAELDELARVLVRHPWVGPVLRLIGENPGVVSTTLATRLDMDRALFKTRVRRLKGLGLTESMTVGYRLSPRGAAFVGQFD